MSWQTSKGFVTSKVRIDRIEKIESIKGIITKGATAKYLTLKDYPELSGLTEGGFAKDIYLKKDAVSKSMVIRDSDNYNDDFLDLSDRSRSGMEKIADVINNGAGNTYIAALDDVKDKDVICFWYNGNWAIVTKNMVGDDPYIPVSLATKIIQSGKIDADDILNQLGKKKFEGDDFESVSAKGMAEKMEMYEDLFSHWKMRGFKGTKNIDHFMLNTHMKDGPYLYKRVGDKVNIKFNMSFEDKTKESDIQVQLSDNPNASYEKLIKLGFEKWNNVGLKAEDEESNYGFGTISSTVTLHEDSSKYKNKNVISIVNSFDEDLFNKYGDDEDYRQAPNVAGNWKIDSIEEMKMTMYNFHTKVYDDGIGYNSEDYENAAGHEFGHLIGLAHAYEPNKDSDTPTESTAEVNADKDIMWFGGEVSFNDMEMVFLAALYNEKQYFNGDNISEAITMNKSQ